MRYATDQPRQPPRRPRRARRRAGRKSLKAVAVAGTKPSRSPTRPARGRGRQRPVAALFGPATAKYRELGTVANLLTFNRLDALPTRNFQQGTFEGAPRLSGEELHEARGVARNSCAACTIGCEHIYAARASGAGAAGVRERCSRSGRCAASPTATPCSPPARSATARPRHDLRRRHHRLRHGVRRARAARRAVAALRQRRRAARAARRDRRREGLGDLLAEGTRARRARRSAARRESTSPRTSRGWRCPATSRGRCRRWRWASPSARRGADHNRSGAYEADFSGDADRLHGAPHGRALAVETEDRAALMDSLILCKFLRGVFADLFAERADAARARSPAGT